MRIRPALPLLPAIVLMAAGCSGVGDDGTATLAEQADRVAQLLDEGRDCEASEALRVLDGLVTDDTRDEVRDAVTTFVTSARPSVGCTTESPSPPPQPPPPPPPEDEAPPAREDDPGRGNDGKDDEDKDDGDKGRGNGNNGNNGNNGRGGDEGDSDD